MFTSSVRSTQFGVGSDPTAQAEAREAKTETELLRHDIERLLMITEALWTILKKQNGYADADLMNLVQEIDLRDGKLDGRVAKVPSPPCPNCGRVAVRNRPLCLYCGSPVSQSVFAR